MRIALVSLLTAVVLFFFGFVWWGLLMPMVKPAEVIGDADLVEQVAESLSESGLYFYPTYAEPDEEYAGPTAMLYFNKQPPAMGQMMGLGFAHMFVTAVLASLCVCYMAPGSFGKRFALVFFLGLFVAVWADVGNMIWWRHPAGWTAFHFAYDVLSWALAGLIIAALVKPNKATASE